MNKIQLIEEPQMVKMTQEETDQTLGGWSCQTYTKRLLKADECSEFYEHGTGECVGGNNYCGSYKG